MRKVYLLLAALIVSMAAWSQDGGSTGTRRAYEVKQSVFFHDGSLDEYTTSEWDKDYTHVDKQIRYLAYGAMLEQVEFTYNDKGDVILKITRDSGGREKNRIERLIDNLYDNKGNRISRKISAGNLWAMTTYNFDNKGKVTLSQTKDDKGNAINSTQYTYDAQGNLIKQEVFNKDGKPSWVVNAVWQAGREVKNELVSANGSIQLRVTNEYGKDGELTKKTVENFKGGSKQVIQYEYVFRPARSGAAPLGFTAQEDMDIYAYLYNAAPDNSSQLHVLQYMSEARLLGAGEFYANALQKLLAEYNNIKNDIQKNAADKQIILLSSMLGAEKYTPAASALWRIMDEFSLPKAEVLYALRKICLPQTIRTLDILNLEPTKDPDGEKKALNAIITLEKLQDPSAYLSVFLASVGWYSQEIRNQATKSLPFIAKDPSPYLLTLIRSPIFDYPTKYLALQTIDKTNVDSKNKAEIAVAALDAGHKAVTNNQRLKGGVLADMRKLSLDMIRRYKTDDTSVYPLLEQSYTSGLDMQEKVMAVNALGFLRTDESARLLSKFLDELNKKCQTGNISQEDQQMVRVLIPALGNTERPIARTALIQVTKLDYTNGIKTLAAQALSKLPN